MHDRSIGTEDALAPRRHQLKLAREASLGRPRTCATWASGSSVSSSCSSSTRRSSYHMRRPSRTSEFCLVGTLRGVRLAAAYHRLVRLQVLSHDGEPIRCDPSGCCLWVARSSVANARMRLYQASRGALPATARIETICGHRRCVNLDHLRVLPRSPRGLGAGGPQCQRGHPLTVESVVRHRDGRIAYCRICRNERRRERYRTDPAFARRELLRQRSLRTRSSGRAGRG